MDGGDVACKSQTPFHLQHRGASREITRPAPPSRTESGIGAAGAHPAMSDPYPSAPGSNYVLTTSSMLSAVGDLMIIIAFLCSPEARRLLPTRMVAYLAMADLLGELPGIGSFQLPWLGPVATWGPYWCEVQAAGNWFANMSVWFWTMAYAYAVASGIDRRSHLQPPRELIFHVLCWGIPAVTVGIMLGLGLLGEPTNPCLSPHLRWRART